MAISIGTVTQGIDAAVSSVTVSHNNNGDFLVVSVAFRNNTSQTITGITYNGVALTKIGDSSSGTTSRVEMWRLINPAVGSHNVVITFSASSSDIEYGIISLSGVHQTTPLGTAVAADSGGVTGVPTVNVSSAAGEVVMDCVIRSGTATLTADASQSEIWNQTSVGVSPRRGGGSTEAGAGTVTMSWSSVPNWAILAVPIKPAAVSANIKRSFCVIC